VRAAGGADPDDELRGRFGFFGGLGGGLGLGGGEPQPLLAAGEIEGMHREWHTNGQPALEVTMVSGTPHGLSRKWNPEGLLVGQWSLSNGVVLATVTNSAELRSLAQKVGVQ
jgi:hypothetical protein